MPKILTKDVADGVTETFEFDETSQTVGVRRSQDVEPIMDYVAQANAAGVREVEGLGVPMFEVPITVAIEFCQKRGIPWEKFLYTNEFDKEWIRFGQEYSRFAYKTAPKYYGPRPRTDADGWLNPPGVSQITPTGGWNPEHPAYEWRMAEQKKMQRKAKP